MTSVGLSVVGDHAKVNDYRCLGLKWACWRSVPQQSAGPITVGIGASVGDVFGPGVPVAARVFLPSAVVVVEVSPATFVAEAMGGLAGGQLVARCDYGLQSGLLAFLALHA